MLRSIPEISKTDIMTGAEQIPIGDLLQILIGDCMPVLKRIITTTRGDMDLLGAGTVAIARIGVGTVAGAGVLVCPGVGADHSDGAGEALLAGEAHTGDTDILLTGVDTMIHSGADIMVIHIGAMEVATGVVTTTDLTEEVVLTEVSVIRV